MDSWYWRVSVHAEDDIRFAFKVLGYSTADLVLLFDRALPIGRRCDIRVIAPKAGQLGHAANRVPGGGGSGSFWGDRRSGDIQDAFA
ncbi:MAG TPA: hypothetical protein DE312_11500 [Gallionella sp.]|nr:MAG: hypothetical protein A2Z87_00440 [Gallionellales bacterium GWA2_54_124]OGT17183.1 MAG: hypothetical protein A2522_03235 [Gallionellales bacterium RIFOXYD12_FULL_53_10]HCI53917.1 hypothetical protein [Gallionella sp.]